MVCSSKLHLHDPIWFRRFYKERHCSTAGTESKLGLLPWETAMWNWLHSGFQDQPLRLYAHDTAAPPPLANLPTATGIIDVTRAEELRRQGQALINALHTTMMRQDNEKERARTGSCSALIQRQTRKLDAYIEGTSNVPEDRVYLAVASLNKGLIEIGGDWRNDERLVELAKQLTDKAFSYFRLTSTI
jgi:hypothetical protein